MTDYRDLDQKLNVVNQQWLTTEVHRLKAVTIYQNRQTILLGTLLCATIALVIVNHIDIEKRLKVIEHAR